MLQRNQPKPRKAHSSKGNHHGFLSLVNHPRRAKNANLKQAQLAAKSENAPASLREVVGQGQAALEFTMTYGWAILMLIVVITVLVFFDVLSVTRFMSERCVASPGFACTDYTVSETSATFVVQNARGESLVASLGGCPDCGWVLNASDMGCWCVLEGGDPSAVNWGADGVKTVECSDCDAVIAAGKGDKQKLTLTSNYTRAAGSFGKPLVLEIIARVEE